jgi:hypothetical protein
VAKAKSIKQKEKENNKQKARQGRKFVKAGSGLP